MEQAPPAGWYPDPERSEQFRYWDGTAWTQQVNAGGQPPRKKHWIVKRSKIAGILIAVWPLISAFIGSLGSNKSMFNEGSGSGASIWLMFMSVPLGLVVIGIGAIAGTILESRARSKGLSQ